MVVMWCNGCGALLGLREPIADWNTERTGFCVNCAERNNKTFKRRIEETNNADEAAANTADDVKASQTSDDLPA